MKLSFPISSEDAEILVYVATSANLREVAERVQKDVSVVSRRLKNLHTRTPFLTKQESKWRLTASGLRFNEWTLKAMREQTRILAHSDEIRIITTREFSNRVLARSPAWLKQISSSIQLMTTDRGIESALIERKADFGFDCGTPYSPSIAFKKGPSEAYGIYYSAHLKNLKPKKATDLTTQSFFYYDRMDLAELRQAVGFQLEPVLTFNEIASLRSFLTHQNGWAILPHYTVVNELKSGQILALNETLKLQPSSFGLWWNRENAPKCETLEHAFSWLKAQNLNS